VADAFGGRSFVSEVVLLFPIDAGFDRPARCNTISTKSEGEPG
jgi:hypothetical protein